MDTLMQEPMNTDMFKKRLEKEKQKLENELGTIGIKNPANPQDWQGAIDDSTVDAAEEGETSDAMDTLETNSALTEELENRLDEVVTALANIQNGTYGVCAVGGEMIEEDRLEANPAAMTCKAHMQ